MDKKPEYIWFDEATHFTEEQFEWAAAWWRKPEAQKLAAKTLDTPKVNWFKF